MATAPALQPPYLCDLLRRILDPHICQVQVVPLHGDASDRRYYRVFPRDGGGQPLPTLVVMQMPPQAGEIDLHPFINIQAYLQSRGIGVPRLLHQNGEQGLLLLEDLGDVTLKALVQQQGVQAALGYYRMALDLVLQMQWGPPQGAAAGEAGCIAFQRAFDQEQFRRELDFFAEQMLERLLQRPLSRSVTRVLQSQFGLLAERLAAEPRCFTHRDYHSRNLMITAGKLRLVDFQDARLGPISYDLASLLRDSYVVLEEPVVDTLLHYYLDGKKALDGIKLEGSSFRHLFDLTAIQRNLKAIGTFAFQWVGKGNPRYLAYVPATWGYVHRNLQRYPAFSPLLAVLEEYLGEITPDWPGRIVSEPGRPR